LISKEARNRMGAFTNSLCYGILFNAKIFSMRAAWRKPAAIRQINRTRWVTDYGRLQGSIYWVMTRHRGEQRSRVGMCGRGKYVCCLTPFDNLSQVHDHHFVCNMADHIKVVADEDVTQTELFFEIG
jgi:hypothetical protein